MEKVLKLKIPNPISRRVRKLNAARSASAGSVLGQLVPVRNAAIDSAIADKGYFQLGNAKYRIGVNGNWVRVKEKLVETKTGIQNA